ncbi:MAG: hypothetical protein QM778_27910 [Myxococcales bacterium]
MSYTSCVLPGLVTIRWGETPDPIDVHAYAGELARARQQQGKPPIAMFIMPVDSGAPSEEFRKAQAGMLPSIMANIDYAVAVFEGTGFTSSLKRSALVAILFLSGKRHAVHVRSTVEEALVRDPPKPLSFDGSKAIAELSRRGILTKDVSLASHGV